MKNNNLGYIEGFLSLVVNIILFALKIWIGIISGSIALIADAWHTLSDSITSVIVLIGFWISGKRPDSEHPFGHGRYENIAAIVIATILIVVGFNFFKEAVLRLKIRHFPNFGRPAFLILITSVVIKEVMARFSIWAGKKIESKSLLADGWHHRSDAVTSAMILAGIILGKNYLWMDSVLGILVSVFILYAAYDIIRDASGSLLGKKVEPGLEEKITDLIENASPLISQVHHLHMHSYGDHMELTLHVCMPDDMKLIEAHKITNSLEKAIKNKFKIETTIHVEPAVVKT